MKSFYVICDDIRSLENLGSIFRTSDALGVAKIFLCGLSAKPPVGKSQEAFLKRNEKFTKTALGAERTVPFEYHKRIGSLIDSLKKRNMHIIALEQGKDSILYTKFKPQFPLALVLGNEVKGIPSAVIRKADKEIYLPMRGKKESLNVSVAFGVAGYYINQFR